MLNKKMLYALAMPALLLMGYSSIAQDRPARTHEENARIDSLARAYKEQAVRDQDASDVQRRENADELSDLKSHKTETKATAKTARRVEREANDAARESKSAYRQEKKAQNARERADKQSKKAKKARTKSDQN